MAFAVFAARHLLAISALALLGYLLGRRVLTGLRFSSVSERVAMCAVLGLGLLGQLAMVLGAIGQLARGPLGVIAALVLLLCWPVWRAWPGRLRTSLRQLRPRSIFAGVALALPALALVGLSLYPPTQWDAVAFHLPVASLFARSGRIQATPLLRFASLPHHGELLFAVMLLFGDDLDAQLVEMLLCALSALTLYAFAARIASPRAGVWAAAAWLGSPLVLFLGASCYVDVGLCAFAAAATVAVLTFRVEREQSWLLLAAALAGLGAATKYQGLCFVAGLGALVLWIERRPGPAARFVAVAVAVAAPWYLLNAAQTGDPFFPLGAPLFGYSAWSAADLESSVAGWHRQGLGRTLAALARLPWNLGLHPEAFSPEAPVSPAFLLALPAVALASARDSTVRLLAAASLAFTLFWFWTAQQYRFYLPALLLLSLASALALDRLLGARHARRRRLVTVAVAAALLSPSLLWMATRLVGQRWPPVGAAARDAYLARAVVPYQALRYLNEERAGRYRLYTLPPFEGARYFAEGASLGDWFGPARFSPLLQTWNDPTAIRAELRRLDVEYLLAPNEGTFAPRMTPAFDAAFMLVYSEPQLTLYRLR